ncbi:DUF3325 family protein [Pleionea sp. CnH1-48]|uniref:DUF3325 family protein n=1 Tax=Pleionea sp. CnH1-48 TaxID=2954494 RepID=UPI003530AA22
MSYLAVLSVYLASPIRFSSLFAKAHYPTHLQKPISAAAWILVILSSWPWAQVANSWEIGIAMWLVSLTLFGILIIFCITKFPTFVKLVSLPFVLLGGISLVF